MTISQYHRPETMEEALKLLGRKTPFTIPLAGGTSIDHDYKSSFEVVDLQALHLDAIEQDGAHFLAGAMVTLQSLLELKGIVQGLANAIELEIPMNQRRMATLGGCIISSDGRSPLATALLALDAELVWELKAKQIGFGDWLSMREGVLRNRIDPPGLVLTSIKWSSRLELCFHYVARTPDDRPIVCSAVAGWKSGRRRIALGGFGTSPLLILDGTGDAGIEQAVRTAFNQAGDEWASAEYRQEIAWILTQRCLAELSSTQ
jgi:CO/xanthine dehydrogenase FAD-binding subunit